MQNIKHSTQSMLQNSFMHRLIHPSFSLDSLHQWDPPGFSAKSGSRRPKKEIFRLWVFSKIINVWTHSQLKLGGLDFSKLRGLTQIPSFPIGWLRKVVFSHSNSWDEVQTAQCEYCGTVRCFKHLCNQCHFSIIIPSSPPPPQRSTLLYASKLKYAALSSLWIHPISAPPLSSPTPP